MAHIMNKVSNTHIDSEINGNVIESPKDNEPTENKFSFIDLDIYTLATFTRNSAQPNEKGNYNIWITKTFGKIGVIQVGSSIPFKVKSIMENNDTECFNALVRIVKEVRPGDNSGIYTLHIIKHVKLSEIMSIKKLNALKVLNIKGRALITLASEDLSSSLLWNLDGNARKILYTKYELYSTIPELNSYVKNMMKLDGELKTNVNNSDLVLSLEKNC